MSITKQIARHFREVYFGGNWTWSNLKDNLNGVTWQQATTKVHTFNTIAVLVYHIHYYVVAVTNVFEGRPLKSNDKFAFDAPPINSEEDWNNMLIKVWGDAERFSAYIEQLPDEKLLQNMAEEKYGNWYRNLHGIIEHTHYHLGQIALIKKIVQQKENDNI